LVENIWKQDEKFRRRIFPWTRSFFDHRHLRFYYRTYENPNLWRIDLKELDFREGAAAKTVDIYGGVPYIDATSAFKN